MSARTIPTIAVVAGLVGLLFVGIAHGAVSLRSLLPGNNSISGWALVSGSEQAAVNQDGLYDLFNGAAPEYISYGVTSALQRAYKHNNTIVTVDICRHNSWQKAKAFFILRRKALQGATGYLSTTNIKAHYAHATTGATAIAYMWSKYYSCSVSVAGGTAADRETAKAFARYISAKITAAHR